MCGFAGYINTSEKKFTNLLNDTHKVLDHRGPDGFGYWKSEEHGILFYHLRLNIIDLSLAASQPMKANSVVICFNGEIYNHLQLRSELESLGYVYFSNSDTESLIYAYKEWGIDFINKLDGMFSIALFDINKNEFYLIRDRIGIKPLYFSNQGGRLSFASEIKALWKFPWVNKDINNLALYHYLTFLATPAPMTLYKGVYKLPAGFYLKLDRNRKLSFKEWYNPLKSDLPKVITEGFCIERVRDLLKESVRKRMMSDVPFGVFLSGGVDSSLNVALMSQFTSRVKTFNVVFEDSDPENDERVWANKVARKFDCDHHQIVVTEKDAFDFQSKMAYHQDEPLADWVCIPLYFVAKLAKDSGVTVVQCGEGADEIFVDILLMLIISTLIVDTGTQLRRCQSF